MPKLSKALMGLLLVFVACAGAREDGGAGAGIGETELAVVAPKALPGDMGSRLTRTCPSNLSPDEERALFGTGGRSGSTQLGTAREPWRVIPAGDGRALRVSDASGTIALNGSSEPLTPAKVGASANAGTGGAAVSAASSSATPASGAAGAGRGRVSVPMQATGASMLTSGDGKMAISAKLRGTKAVAAQASDGLVVYPGGHTDGDVVVHARDDGAEDWLLLTRPPSGGASLQVPRLGASSASGATPTPSVAPSGSAAPVGSGAPSGSAAPVGSGAASGSRPPSAPGSSTVSASAPAPALGSAAPSASASVAPFGSGAPNGGRAPGPAVPSPEMRPSGGSIEYEVALTKGVSSVRLVANTVEFLDENGVPRLRMAPPRLVDNACKTFDATVSVTGCAVDTSPAAPQGKSHPAPAASSCVVSLAWDSTNVSYPVSLDPTWSSTASMSNARAFHTATLLNGSPGKVLVAGGASPSGTLLQSAELFDPGTNVWAATGGMAYPHNRHAAAKFADGEVFVSGGYSSYSTWIYVSSAVERYSVSSGTWSAATSLPTPVADHTMDVFANDWLYIAGGIADMAGNPTNAVAAYFRPYNYYYYTPSLPSARAQHASVVASDGVYVLGGSGSAGSTLTSVVRYNPGVNTLTTMPSMATPRSFFSAALLPSNQILVAGGNNGVGTNPQTAAVETLALPNPASWVARPAMATPGLLNRIAVRSGGPIVIGGLQSYSPQVISGATTIYDNVAVALAGPSLSVARYAHTATVLSDNRVLVAGGLDASLTVTDTVEILSNTGCSSVAQCDDSNPCTVDACVSGFCANTAQNPTSLCQTDDGNACNGVSTCSTTGQCVTGAAVVPTACQECGAGNALVTKAAGAPCSLAAFVTTCKTAGHCTGASSADSACVAQIAPDGTSCGSTNLCTGVSVCRSGSCAPRPGISALADVHDPCVMTTCDPNLGIVSTRNASCGVVNPAPPASQTTSTTFEGSTDFLTASGGQLGVVLDVARRAVVRGYAKVLDANGSPTVDDRLDPEKSGHRASGQEVATIQEVS